MALLNKAIDSRLEALKQDDRRLVYDSKLQAYRSDSRSDELAENRVTTLIQRSDNEDPIGLMIVLIEEVSRQLDRLEKKHRALRDEIRDRAGRDRRLRVGLTIGGLIVGMILLGYWLID